MRLGQVAVIGSACIKRSFGLAGCVVFYCMLHAHVIPNHLFALLLQLSGHWPSHVQQKFFLRLQWLRIRASKRECQRCGCRLCSGVSILGLVSRETKGSHHVGGLQTDTPRCAYEREVLRAIRRSRRTIGISPQVGPLLGDPSLKWIEIVQIGFPWLPRPSSTKDPVFLEQP